MRRLDLVAIVVMSAIFAVGAYCLNHWAYHHEVIKFNSNPQYHEALSQIQQEHLDLNVLSSMSEDKPVGFETIVIGFLYYLIKLSIVIGAYSLLHRYITKWFKPSASKVSNEA